MKTHTLIGANNQGTSLGNIAKNIFRPFIIDESPDFIEKNINLTRILVGLGIFHSYLDILGYSLFLSPQNTYKAITVLILSFLFIIGFFTPLVCGLLIWNFAYPVVGYLGTMVLVIFLWGMFFAGVGRRWSVDACLLNFKPTRRIINCLYIFSLPPGNESLGKVRFLILFLFWCVCIRAMIFHLDDSVWLTGKTLQLLFNTPYLTDHYLHFREFSKAFPLIYDFLCSSALFIQSFWEFLIIPLMYFRWGRIFVMAQGMAFFLASFFLINLGYLPYYEICMWIFLFNYSRCLNLKTGRLFYDDRCNLCKKTVLFVKAIDFYDRIDVEGLSKAPLQVKHAFAKNVQIIYQNKDNLFLGFDAYYQISKSIFPFCIAFPVFFAGKITGLGHKTYNWVGQRRERLFGVCEPFSYSSETKPTFEANRWSVKFFSLFLVTSILLATCPDKTRLLGQADVDVLNNNDLKMGAPGIVLIETNESYEFKRTVPFMDINGGRLSYLRNDLLYFKLSLPWQRQYAGMRNPNKLSNDFKNSFRKLAESVSVLDSCQRQASGMRYYRADLFIKKQEMNDYFSFWGTPKKVVSHAYSIDMDQLNKSIPKCKWTYVLPPGHLSSAKRISLTDSFYKNSSEQEIQAR